MKILKTFVRTRDDYCYLKLTGQTAQFLERILLLIRPVSQVGQSIPKLNQPHLGHFLEQNSKL